MTLTVTDACGVEDEFEVDVEVPVYDPITGTDVGTCALGIQGDLNLDRAARAKNNIAGNWEGNYTFYAWQYYNYNEQGYPQDSTLGGGGRGA